MVDLKLQIPDSFYNEETRCGFTVTRERKKLWAVQLDLLNEFDRVCKEHGLRYFADGGTALGAVRHNGFIPWDDDIDIEMFRPDYERLCEIAAGEFSYPYFFQTEYSDPGSLRGHAQLRNSETTGILMTELEIRLPFNQGIFIDIFPVDNLPADDRERNAFIEHVRKKRIMARIYARLTSRFRKCAPSPKEYIIRGCHALLGNSENPFYKSFERLAQSISEPTGVVGLICLPVVPDSLIWQLDWYRETVYLPFEMLEIPVCAGYDSYLTRLYGDWKTPVREETYHGGVLFDTDRPYGEYLGK